MKDANRCSAEGGRVNEESECGWVNGQGIQLSACVFGAMHGGGENIEEGKNGPLMGQEEARGGRCGEAGLC